MDPHANLQAVGHAAELGRLAVHNVSYLWLIPLFPLVGAAINALVGWKLQKLFGKKIVHRIAVTAMFASFAVALRAFWQLLHLHAGERFARTRSGTCSPPAASRWTSRSRSISSR